MSKGSGTSLGWLAWCAALIPLIAVGYIAGNNDVLQSFRVHLEAGLSGSGSDYERTVKISEAVKPISAGAAASFERSGKSARADLALGPRPPRAGAGLAPKFYGADAASVAPPKTRGTPASAKAHIPGASAPKLSRPPSGTLNVGLSDELLAYAQEHPKYVSASGLGQLMSGSMTVGAGARAFFATANLAESGKLKPLAVAAATRPAKPVEKGLAVKRVMLATPVGQRKFFGGLTESEFRRREVRCLATAIYFEARGESILGQKAVAQVVMNRVRSYFYPDTICGVVYQGMLKRNKCQFSFACDGRRDVPREKKQWEIANDLAQKVVDAKIYLKDLAGATHYHATYVSPPWRRNMIKIKRIGLHIFYKAKFLPTPGTGSVEIASSD